MVNEYGMLQLKAKKLSMDKIKSSYILLRNTYNTRKY